MGYAELTRLRWWMVLVLEKWLDVALDIRERGDGEGLGARLGAPSFFSRRRRKGRGVLEILC